MKTRIFLLILLALLLASCGGGQTEIKPPTIRYGEDKCADCDMIINEPRFAAAAIREISASDYESLLFDDIGDLVRYMAEHQDMKFAAAYVHDYDTEAWVEVEKATFMRSKTLKTPMMSGLAASSSQGGAEALAAKWNGTVLDWPTLQKEGAGMSGGMGGSH